MISIVTAYYNRREALIRTLKTISKSSFKDFEFIIIDDASDDTQRIDDLASSYPFIKLIRVEPKDKTYINPCVPFNMGFELAKGAQIIIQNPECMHMGDVLNFVAHNSKDNRYLVFSCYSLGQSTSDKLRSVDFNLPSPGFEYNVSQAIGGFTDRNCDYTTRYDSWFAHPKYRVAYFNFLTSMTRKDLYDLGGFDEKFAYGHAFDDTDLVARIEKKGMDIILIEHPFCLHQYHPPFLHDISNFHANESRNRSLYETYRKLPHYKSIESRLLGKE
jgi:glycosyltransferase involved in cell wall biosynthesis